MSIFGIGTDIVSIQRIHDIIQKYPQFRSIVLSTEELAAAKDSPEYVAGRWAAKEAIAKAIGTGFGRNCRMTDITILNNSDGKPQVYLKGNTYAHLSRICPTHKLHISISHDGHAVAFCVIENLPEGN